MAEIVIRLERGPDDQPVGEVRLNSGHVAAFIGWLALIRLLEDEMRALPLYGAVPSQTAEPPGAGQP
jgi:hypothetical protein